MSTPLPTTLVRTGPSSFTLSDAIVRIHAALLEDFRALPPVATPDNVHQHDAFAAQAQNFRKKLEAARKEAKEPSIREGKAIDEAAKTFDRDIEAALKVASAASVAVQQQVARARAEAEAARRRAEQDALEREAILAAERAKLAGSPESVGDQAALFELESEHRAASAAAYIQSLDAVPDDLGKMSVTARKVPTLVVDSLDDVPCVVAGVCIRPVDEAAVRKLLRAGVVVPGCRMVDIAGSSTRGA